jgi:succinylglutamate desuccinylase
MTNLAEELARFDDLSRATSKFVDVRSLNEHVTVLSPKQESSSMPSLALSSLIHGNEIIGIYILNKVFSEVLSGSIRIQKPIALIAANREAALAGKRFLDRDLNRSFGREEQSTREDRICRLIEPILTQSTYTLDLHQTILGTASPFFIFRAHKNGFDFATALNPDLPIVTLWNNKASADGRLLTEFNIERSLVAITLELGKAGYDPHQVELGVAICKRAIEVSFRNLKAHNLEKSKLYLLDWFYRPTTKEAALDPGWQNFSTIIKGQRLGIDGKREILSPVDGKMLFPKYGEYAKSSSELFCALVPMRHEELARL